MKRSKIIIYLFITTWFMISPMQWYIAPEAEVGCWVQGPVELCSKTVSKKIGGKILCPPSIFFKLFLLWTVQVSLTCPMCTSNFSGLWHVRKTSKLYVLWGMSYLWAMRHGHRLHCLVHWPSCFSMSNQDSPCSLWYGKCKATKLSFKGIG